MSYGFVRTACASPVVTVADCKKNADNIISLIKRAEKDKVALLVLPELALTGYTCGDLFLQPVLLQSALKELERVALCVHTVTVIVGVPVINNGILYNTAAVICHGEIKGFVPKSFIPNYSEFYEYRHFAPAENGSYSTEIQISGKKPYSVPFGTDLIFADSEDSSISLAVEICEDVWTVTPPSLRYALQGATIIANCSASNEVIGKASFRRSLIQAHSARVFGAYLYADAGSGESTTDVVFSAHNIIAENGTILSESQPFSSEDGYIVADIDVQKLVYERRKTTTFAQNMRSELKKADKPRIIPLSFTKFDEKDTLRRTISPFPFIPQETTRRTERCTEVTALQTQGLVKRLAHTHAKSAVIGLSGGLDSTLALLITVQAFRKLSLDTKGIIAVTMPCFGTTERTYNNARTLADSLGLTFMDIPIKNAVIQHFKDIGQDETVHDVTYENSQARERTQVLMDIANKNSGLVIGTGDLSELALGWATYNGDHMSMYGVNSSIPKTLVRHLVNWFADSFESEGNTKAAVVLRDILDTPVSPELLPPENGQISQKTEDIVGPYELHDFVLYYFLRWGFEPEKILFLEERAFGKTYSRETMLKWLRIFYRRFFSQQFKRSCLPDGAKVGTVSISPRGDWRMPSDAEAAAWLERLETLT